MNILQNHKRIELLFLPKVKRGLDIFFALLAIFFISPLIILTAIVTRIAFGSPLIFRQERPGRGGKVFLLYKFRTMTNDRNDRGEMLPDALRLTRIGKILRASSLDELPELFNILRGEMSFIGPRPLLVEYLPLYTQRQLHRHDVTPGLTGLAQVSGRNSVDWEKRFELDLYYVENWDLLLDLKILLVTIKNVFTGEGVNAEDHVTMPKFQGSADSREQNLR